MSTTDTSTPWTADDAEEFLAYFLDFEDEQWVEVPSSVGPDFARALRLASVGFTYSPRVAVCTRHDDPHETDRFTRVRSEFRPRLH